jgi:hypothetical protein
MRKSRSLIRLADNPFGDEELAPPEAEAEDEFGGGMGGGVDEDPFGEEGQDEMGEDSMYQMRKGRKLRGPRVKLSVDGRISNLEKGVADLAETVASLAKSTTFLGKAVIARLQKEDDEDEDDAKEDKAKVRKGVAKVRKADYASDTGVGATKDVGDDRTSQEETENETGITEGELTLGQVRKDDAAGNFGEKDEDMPGNAPAGIDEKDKSPDDYLLQGGPGDGPGPQVSAAVKAELEKAVNAVYARHGILRKAQGPRPGTGSGAAAQGDEAAFTKIKDLSFRQINQMRTELGLLPNGLI